MEPPNHIIRCFLRWVLNWKAKFVAKFLIIAIISDLWWLVSGLGSMSSIAVSYGESGPVFCGLKSDGSHFAACYGANAAILYGTPAHLSFVGLTGGAGFVCGLVMDTYQPYCWGSNDFIRMGVPQPMNKGSEYVEISAGDNHLCGLRKPLTGNLRNTSLVDCWGYNMTSNYVFEGEIKSISSGAEFNCGLFVENQTAFCWGDETSSQVIRLLPMKMKFQMISAGGYHVCGIVEGVQSRAYCWGKSLNNNEEISVGFSGQGNVDIPPKVSFLSIVGGKFHACGIRDSDRGVVCWGSFIDRSIPAPGDAKVYTLAGGDYFSCGILIQKSLTPMCWGYGFPTSLPVAVSPGLCKTGACDAGYYEFKPGHATCKNPSGRICLPCLYNCPKDMFPTGGCSEENENECAYNCSSCASSECLANCSSKIGGKKYGFWGSQVAIIVAEVVFGVLLVTVVFFIAVLYVRYRLRKCECSKRRGKNGSGSPRDNPKIRPDMKMRRAKVFRYEELERATSGFKEETIVGRGSFSCVFKGVLKDGTIVAVKRAIVTSDQKKNSKEFHTELDLLSRLNHAHLLNLLGYCEEGEERVLVYEFMAHGSLHHHLHGKDKSLKEQLDWVKRVTIAVQASRGIEYLHGYACPPVIHRDIKSSNILIDEHHNARVADFGLSLLGPADSGSPLAELPAGTLGYLDPEYYRLHYLTTKSDVYSFGVLLLEILSGRKAIDMHFEQGNIVEWAVPLVKAGHVSAILDPVLKSPPPPQFQALRRIANVASKCVRMRGKDRPSMDKVTTALERALALLMGTPSSHQPILPTEVVLGSSRMHKKSSQRSSNPSETDIGSAEDQPFEFRAPSWITFPSVTSSQRRKSSVSEADVENAKLPDTKNLGTATNGVELNSLEEEIGPASPQETLFLKHNF
ncbi:serine/threonine-protein kinase-like protein ACR4 [Amaranthus tricolor]|uniref:serine/threonine-protein kinase-like protein ACR4 n=1 Tax=Amaranthus tricolor TaxID=29722 RepID=UPI0025893B70|nr:serine/threonine-protein kinase-like protein ACR4 [Amaranthus tricolor]